MPRRVRSIFLAALEGALAGSLAGLFLGVWHALLHGDASSRMWFLFAWRVDRFAFVVLLAGIGLSVVLALLARARPGRVARPAVVLLPLLASTGILVFGPSRHWLFTVLGPPGTPDRVAWISAAPLVVAALAIVLARLRDTTSAGTLPASPLRRPSAALGLLLGGLVLATHLALPVVAARRAAGHPSVVLISIDTLRADRLGAAGYSRNLTPALDRLADQGATFLQATSTAPWTFPAHVSLFTSTLPFDSGERIWRATPDMVMLAEIFRNAGYRTLAHTGGTWVDGRIGFAQGFESFDSHDEIQLGGPASYLAQAADWIDDLAGAPFFLFLHTYEPHIPYRRHDFADPGAAGRVGRQFDFEDLERLRGGRLAPSDVEKKYIIDLYDGNVAAADRYVGEFLDRLDALRSSDHVIVMVISDHGEDLWDHVPERSADHGHSLHEELLRIPWIVRKTGQIAPGLQIHQPVSLLDLPPTLLELAQLAPDARHRGRSLASNLRHGTEPSSQPVFAEMVEYGPDRFSVRRGDLKVIHTPFPEVVHSEVRLDVPRWEIFDLARDPLEKVRLARCDPQGCAPLAQLLKHRAAFSLGHEPPSPAESEGAPEELLEQMRALGYTN